jgi:chromosome segregation ATPase
LIKNKAAVDKTPTVVGPVRAQRHLRSHATEAASSSTTLDPWLSPAQDPWQCYKGAAAQAESGSTKRYDALVTQLTTDVQASIQQQGVTDATADTARIQKLETDMEEIKAHNATFHSWFKETGTKLARQDEQLAHLQTAVQQQHQDLQVVRTEVHTSADNLHQAMQSSFGTMKNDLAAELTSAVATQMDRLEGMLSKRQRSEC